MTDEEIEGLLAAILRDGCEAWPAAITDTVAERILSLAGVHGVASLLHAKAVARANLSGRLVEGLRAHSLGTAMRELGERRELRRLVSALVRNSTRPLLFKGAALAYALYSDPAQRERADSDILVGPEERGAAHDTLKALGWQQLPGTEAELASRQASYCLTGPGDVTYWVDLHWCISNSAVLGSLFDHGELWRRSVPLPALHPEARGTCPVDALLIACMHRLAHLTTPYFSNGVARFSADRLIWLHDIRLLANTLSSEDWREFERRARDKGLADACRDGLLSARARLGAACPDSLLDAADPAASRLAPAIYLRAGWLRREWMDFRAVRGVSGKLRFLAEVAFPPVDYMRGRQAGDGSRWLPWLYVRRAAAGVAKRFRGRPTEPGQP